MRIIQTAQHELLTFKIEVYHATEQLLTGSKRSQTLQNQNLLKIMNQKKYINRFAPKQKLNNTEPELNKLMLEYFSRPLTRC